MEEKERIEENKRRISDDLSKSKQDHSSSLLQESRLFETNPENLNLPTRSISDRSAMQHPSVSEGSEMRSRSVSDCSGADQDHSPSKRSASDCSDRSMQDGKHPETSKENYRRGAKIKISKEFADAEELDEDEEDDVIPVMTRIKTNSSTTHKKSLRVTSNSQYISDISKSGKKYSIRKSKTNNEDNEFALDTPLSAPNFKLFKKYETTGHGVDKIDHEQEKMSNMKEKPFDISADNNIYNISSNAYHKAAPMRENENTKTKSIRGNDYNNSAYVDRRSERRRQKKIESDRKIAKTYYGTNLVSENGERDVIEKQQERHSSLKINYTSRSIRSASVTPDILKSYSLPDFHYAGNPLKISPRQNETEMNLNHTETDQDELITATHVSSSEKLRVKPLRTPPILSHSVMAALAVDCEETNELDEASLSKLSYSSKSVSPSQRST
eukprot:CAMPEP_0182433606 /NCGR_PEP_ID=MMETSP1167-20130531/64274_1 /TAXON_ID=2988 /ORGANISM="Mallomonas Sp, Strain CCMP3275" /LENGTH=441 /DNA_ID=CAMNT_0024622473 /DNA_START=295 /DNA_END=1620 /DNA_ORIENTATION=-